MNKNLYCCLTVVLLVLLFQHDDVGAHKLPRGDVVGPEVEVSGVGQPHTRNKRTIGHIFNMFKGFMSNMFGPSGAQRGKGRVRGRQRPSSSYGPPQSTYGAPQPGYSSPSQPSSPPVLPPGGNVDSYGSPQAPTIDSYGSPQAPAIDGYGSPPSPAVTSYGSPQAPSVDSYGSPQTPLLSSGSPQVIISAPRVPNLSSYGDIGSGFSGSVSTSSLADNVFKMLPAPNLATETPQQLPNQDSYGSPQSSPIGPTEDFQGQGTPDSYGSPQAGVLSGGNSAPDSYGIPETDVLSVGNSVTDSYGSPQVAVLSVGNTFGEGPAVIEARPAQNSYGSPLTNVVQPEVIAARPAQNLYGSPQVDIAQPEVIAAGPSQDAYGAPHSNPFLTSSQPSLPSYGVNPRIVDNPESSPQNALDLYGSPEPQGIPPNENYGSPDQPDGELVSTNVDSEVGVDQGPAFDNLRDNVGEKQVGSTEVPNLEDDDGSATTTDPVFPGYEDVDYDQSNYQYDDSDVKNGPGLPGYGGNQAVTLPLRVPGRKPAPQTNDLGTYQIKSEPVDSNSLKEEEEGSGEEEADDQPEDGQPEDLGEAELSKYGEVDSYQSAQTEEYPELEAEEADPSVDATTEATFVSVPLVIEEVNDKESDPTVILAGSPEAGSVGYESPRSGRDNDPFHEFLVDAPNAKRQADWSQRIREKQRQRVWRQFQLD